LNKFKGVLDLNDYPDLVKSRLLQLIDDMAQEPGLFVKNPGKDFSRNRKLNFTEMIRLLLSMGGNSLGNELMECFSYDVDAPSASAFVQQRDKILPAAFESLMHRFTESFPGYKTFDGYRLLAVDGSSLAIAHNPKGVDTYFQSLSDQKGFNLLHLNAMYDLCNHLYVDAVVQPGRKQNEFRALTDMVDRSDLDDKVIVIADRGYESYNVFAHIAQKGWKYVIRVKDLNSNGILSGFDLPEDTFDLQIHMVLTRKQTNVVKANPTLYKLVPKASTFDYLDLKINKFYPISLRIVRFKISDTTYETIITNLDKEEFPACKIKELYHMRWGIETSFRELKYSIGLTSFHSKKVEYITQEIFARLTIYNFCELITMHVVIQQKDTKYGYQANFTAAIKICRYFFKCLSDASPPDVEALIQKNILPIRNGRNDPRKVKPRSAVSFLYRVA
jgi:hypothetical protein